MIIYIATRNPHKLKEIEVIAQEYGFKVSSIGARKLEIQADNLLDIALFAAKSLPLTDAPVIVEDAGLFIKSLNGFPGPYSSYIFRTIGVNGILKLLENIEDREAYFESVIALKLPSGDVKVFSSRVHGKIAYESRGERGFGFDPIFIPTGSNKTFGEMSLEEKNLYSHRAKAVKKVLRWLISKYTQY